MTLAFIKRARFISVTSVLLLASLPTVVACSVPAGDPSVADEINTVTGVSNLVTTLKDTNNVPQPWFGAGVTPQAPTTSK